MTLLLPLILAFKVTWYAATGHPMANGAYPYPGAAACSNHYRLGTVIALAGPDGWYSVTCADRGRINGERWIDVYAETAAQGRYVAENLSPYSYGVVIEKAGK